MSYYRMFHIKKVFIAFPIVMIVIICYVSWKKLDNSSVISARVNSSRPRSIDSSPQNTLPTDSYNRNFSTYAAVKSDILLTTPEIIAKYGYPVEEHIVQTKDGYLLTHFRIPYGSKGLQGKRGPPVILQHGLFASSDTWILMGTEKSLGFILADAGYDVWLTNIRGNRHGRKHTTLSITSRKFWDFSWHDMGCYDMPATIDYILDNTGEKKVYYIGHSMGTTMLFVMASMKPEYNDKLRLGIALAPVAYIRSNRIQLVKSLVPSSRAIRNILNSSTVLEILPYDTDMANFFGILCRKDNPAQFLCVLLYNIIFGEDTVQLNKALLPVYFTHLAAGTSLKSILHYAQVIKSGEFQRFDYGPKENMKLYKQRTPPNYELEKITVPIALNYGAGDPVTSVESIELLSRRLPHVVSSNLVPHAKFNHIDFILANDGKSLLFNHILELMKAY